MRDDHNSDVIRDRKSRDLRQFVDYDGAYSAAAKPPRRLATNEKRFARRRWQQYDPDFYDSDKRSMRPMK